jgi:hypothetical protein
MIKDDMEKIWKGTALAYTTVSFRNTLAGTEEYYTNLNGMRCFKIWSFHGGGYEEDSFLGCNALWLL